MSTNINNSSGSYTRMAPLCVVCNVNAARRIESKNKWSKWCSNKCLGKDPEVLAKKRQTNKERYGDENHMRVPSIRKKLADNNIAKYGVDNVFKLQEYQDKAKETVREKYGVDNVSTHPDIVAKITEKAIKKWTDKDLAKEMLDKRIATNLEKYGSTNNSNSHLSGYSREKLHDFEWLKHRHFVLKKSCEEIARELGCSPTPVLKKFEENGVDVIRHSVSFAELEVGDYIESIIGPLSQNKEILVERNTRKIISPKELDVYVPLFNFAVEFDGVYWHSERHGKHQYFHSYKNDECEKLGISLYHVYDVDWNCKVKREVIKSDIAKRLGLISGITSDCYKIYAIDEDTARNFLENNSIYRFIETTNYLGYYDKNELVAILTYTVDSVIDIKQYVEKKYSVYSDALSLLVQEIKKMHSLISYKVTLPRHTNSSLTNEFIRAGFSLVEKIDPVANYFVICNNEADIKTLDELRDIKNQQGLTDTSIEEFIQLYGYETIWTAGQLVYELCFS